MVTQAIITAEKSRWSL